MMAREDPITGHHYLPLQRHGKHYVAAHPCWAETLIASEDFQKEIDAHYQALDTVAEIDGVLYQTTVYVSEDQTAYVLVTSDRRPVAAHNIAPRRDDVHVYLSALNTIVEQTESYPTRRGEHVRHLFVDPHVVQLTMHPEKARRRPWSDITRHSHVVIVGEPGMGKTTLLRALACHSIDEFRTREESRIPIYIALRDFAKDDHLVLRCDSALAEAERDSFDFETLAPSGRLVLLLDGLDEMPEEARARLLMQVLQLRQQYPTVNLVITSRTGSYYGEFRDFQHYELQPFDDAQCQQWIEWKLEPQESWSTSSRLWQFIADDLHLRDVVRTPLLLAIAVFLYRQNNNVPSGKARLLSRFVEALAGSWDEIRGITRAASHGLNRDIRLKHLQRAASICTFGNVHAFYTDDYLGWQMQLLESSDAIVALRDIAESTGLWLERPDARWEFRHRIFQNFLTAKHLVESTEDVIDRVADRIEEADWSEIWSFVASITPDASRFLQSICTHPPLERERRARLLSAVLTSEIQVSVAAFETAGQHLAALLSELLRENLELSIPLQETTERWLMALYFRRDADPKRVQTIRRTIVQLLTGDSSHHRLRLSDLFDNAEDETIRHLARGMREEGPLLQQAEAHDEAERFIVSREFSG